MQGLEKFKQNLIIQGPMAGYSDRAFRHMMIDYHCPVTTSEMISVEGLIRDSEKTFELLKLAGNESGDNFVVQLFGSKALSFAKSTESILKIYRPLCIDINAGCSVRKVVKTGSGVALMSNIKTMQEIIKAIKSVDENLLVSIKFRLGLTFESINYIDFAFAACDAGADILTLHPRTASQGFSGNAEHKYTAKLKRILADKIIIASGDIMNVQAIEKVKSETKCDMVMIARGAIGNPQIFENMNKADLDNKSRIRNLYRHFELLQEYEGEKKARCLIRKFIKPYTSGISGFEFNEEDSRRIIAP